MMVMDYGINTFPIILKLSSSIMMAVVFLEFYQEMTIQNSLKPILKPNMVAVLRDWQKISDLIIMLRIRLKAYQKLCLYFLMLQTYLNY